MKLVSIPLTKYVLPYYYSVVPSEAASNLSRFDGIRYGTQQDPFESSENLFEAMAT